MNKDLDALIADLEGPDEMLRHQAVFALKRFHDDARPAIPALLKLLLANDPYIRILAARAIGKIAPEDPSAVPVLIEALNDPNELNRAAACEFLGERRHKTAVLRTMQLFSDSVFIVRFAAAKAVGRTFGEWMHATAMCVAMLKDQNQTNRAMGAQCLLSIRRQAQDHLDLLSMALNDVEWDVRLDIEEALAELRRQ